MKKPADGRPKLMMRMKMVFPYAYHVCEAREGVCGAPRVHLRAPPLHKLLSSLGTGFWEGVWPKIDWIMRF